MLSLLTLERETSRRQPILAGGGSLPVTERGVFSPLFGLILGGDGCFRRHPLLLGLGLFLLATIAGDDGSSGGFGFDLRSGRGWCDSARTDAYVVAFGWIWETVIGSGIGGVAWRLEDGSVNQVNLGSNPIEWDQLFLVFGEARIEGDPVFSSASTLAVRLGLDFDEGGGALSSLLDLIPVRAGLSVDLCGGGNGLCGGSGVDEADAWKDCLVAKDARVYRWVLGLLGLGWTLAHCWGFWARVWILGSLWAKMEEMRKNGGVVGDAMASLSTSILAMFNFPLGSKT